MLLFYFGLKFEQRVEQGFGTWRTTAHVNIDGNNSVHALQHRITAVHATRTGARAHGDDPFRFRHLVVNTTHSGRHFVGHGARDDHAVSLAGGKTHDLGAETGDVETTRCRR